VVIAASLLAVLLIVAFAVPARTGVRTIRVPADEDTIQDAIDVARDGDTILVSPGIYHEELVLDGKHITLASQYWESGDEDDIRRTVLDGRVPTDAGGRRRAVAVISVGYGVGRPTEESSVQNKGSEFQLPTKIVGFTIQHGDDGISCRVPIEIAHNIFTENTDGIDYESGGGVCRHNVFRDNRDDGIDLDSATAVIIEHNVIAGSKDDGIEIRLHPYSGPTLNVVIRNNTISDSGEDAIQLIDYPDDSDRKIIISHNVIDGTKMAAIGCTSEGIGKEDYEGASLPEPVIVHNNTFVDNHYGICGGDAMAVVNNIFWRTKKTALKKVDGESVITHNLFWKNGQQTDSSNTHKASMFHVPPQLTDDYHLAAGSPCIDAGVALVQLRGDVHSFEPQHRGAAFDLGAFEFASDDYQ